MSPSTYERHAARPYAPAHRRFEAHQNHAFARRAQCNGHWHTCGAKQPLKTHQSTHISPCAEVIARRRCAFQFTFTLFWSFTRLVHTQAALTSFYAFSGYSLHRLCPLSASSHLSKSSTVLCRTAMHLKIAILSAIACFLMTAVLSAPVPVCSSVASLRTIYPTDGLTIQ